ncbi:hypothetical protein [Joostella sp. CR20]|uniref:hypothetical protein n=1 Tax=Joostella sp. CR20 TaxID=2804312 RepID=UPI00313A9C0F
MKKKEIFWFVGTITVALILNIIIFGIDRLQSGSSIDINIHDSYFILPSIHFIALLGIFVFFITYLIRTFNKSFKNLTSNLILMISTIFLILILNEIKSIIDIFSLQTSNWSISLPLSTNNAIDQIDQNPESKENYLDILSSFIFYFLILLMVFLAFCGFKTGMNYKKFK